VRAADKAYQTVKSGIISGRFAAASGLTEHEVAAAAGVSRTPAREALRRLHAEGFVAFTPNQGAVVSEWSEGDADEIFAIRAMLEAHGAQRAAQLATTAQVAELRALAEAQQAETLAGRRASIDRIAELNSLFHRRLQDAAASPRLTRSLAALLEASLIMKTFRNYSSDDLERSVAHHLELVRAIEAKDGEWAASVMRSHVLSAKRTLQSGRH
jgi:hypothetical protein